jgi:chaperone required for assembly of F1-ATPase
MKRFYEDVTVETRPDGVGLLLDGRAVKTPARQDLILPNMAFAETVADEWRDQGEQMDPATMPLTRLANSVVDGVMERLDEVREGLLAYGSSDLICHWADHPKKLVKRQAKKWQPVLDWWAEDRGATFKPVQGLFGVEQDAAALAVLESDLAALDGFRLAALYEMTNLTGSILLSLAVLHRGLKPKAAWKAAHVDEDFQIKEWGEDEEAAVRRESRRRAFKDAVRALRLLEEPA